VRDSAILNADQLAGRRRIEVSYDTRVAALEFSLFAVPK
jgi:hypothetical protein